MAYTIDYINTICTDLGGSGGHEYEIDGLNEICTLLSATAGHTYNIDALNAICTALGYTAGWTYDIEALNTIVVGGTYQYEVHAWADIQQGSLLNQIPAAPTLLIATVLSDVQINLAWTINATNQDGHRIYISTDNTTFTEKDTVLGITATYSATGLTPFTLYYFKVVAYKSTNESDASNTVSGTTLVPSELSDTANNFGHYIFNDASNIKDGSNKLFVLKDLNQNTVSETDVFSGTGVFDSSTGWSLGDGWAISGGKLNGTAGVTSNSSRSAGGFLANAVYRMKMLIDSISGSYVVFVGNALSPLYTTTGAKEQDGIATTAYCGVRKNSTTNCVIDDLQAFRILGNHLVQAENLVANSTPTYSNDYLTFNGTVDALLTAVGAASIGSIYIIVKRIGTDTDFIVANALTGIGEYGSNKLIIGSNIAYSAYYNLQIKEIFIRSVTDSDAVKNKLNAYFQKKNNVIPPSNWAVNPYFYLPPVSDGVGIPIIANKELTIYGDSLCNVEIVNDLAVTYTCNIGTQSGNDFVINSDSVGNHSLTIKIMDGDYFVSEITTYISVYPLVNTGNFSLMEIGDSLIYNGCDTEFAQLASTFDGLTISDIGTQLKAGLTKYHEGYSSQYYSWFATNEASPFVKSGVIDIASYFTDNSLSVPTYMYMRCGVNDMFNTALLSDLQISAVLSNMDSLINAFLAYNSSVKIIVGIPSSCENRGTGWAASYAGGAYENSQNVFSQNIHNFWTKLIPKYRNGVFNSRVSICYAPLFLDRETGYPTDNGVHCNGTGYAMLGNGLAAEINRLKQ